VRAQYGENVLSHTVIYEWIEMFKNGHMSVTDAECLGRAATTTAAQNEERALELKLQNRRVMADEIAKQMNISIGSASSVVCDNIQLHEVCADERKCVHLHICSCHLAWLGLARKK
jgi:hypothetical protein